MYNHWIHVNDAFWLYLYWVKRVTCASDRQASSYFCPYQICEATQALRTLACYGVSSTSILHESNEEFEIFWSSDIVRSCRVVWFIILSLIQIRLHEQKTLHRRPSDASPPARTARGFASFCRVAWIVHSSTGSSTAKEETTLFCGGKEPIFITFRRKHQS